MKHPPPWDLWKGSRVHFLKNLCRYKFFTSRYKRSTRRGRKIRQRSERHRSARRRGVYDRSDPEVGQRKRHPLWAEAR
ncbi:hypothetical protein EVAR_35752_1 [Eumeta japonica]|uniref:Uncharacterized protein n=1 Tax=Eumeta variegata TaxID=151549 RepID=A0A4C1VDW8_EUMVA|nr:hypothetical protein EVAR_35752_1 [Eumeta japonica]